MVKITFFSIILKGYYNNIKFTIRNSSITICVKRGVRRLANDKNIAMIKTGAYLKNLRKSKGLSLMVLGEHLGVSAAYLSNVESGDKTMSDYFVRQVADFYKGDESVLFTMLDRVPLLAREQLTEDSNLQSLLVEIKRNKKLTDGDKQKLFQQMLELYKNFPE
jgi:transcriptional regulator with XRE-family HTH domain